MSLSQNTTLVISAISNILKFKRYRLWSSALLGVLVLVVRRWALSSKPLPDAFVRDVSKIARRVVKASGKEYDDDEFDVIIVGGGTAGCVLAARLSEDPSIRVLLLEAGQSLIDHPGTNIPAACGDLFFNNEHSYGLRTIEQKNAASRKMVWPRAKMLGGCTNINAMIFHSGHPTDYDEWASLQKNQDGASGWRYEEFRKYFRKFEKYTHSEQHGAEVDPSLRGSTGEVNVGHFAYHSVAGAAFVSACNNLGISKKQDLNTAAGTIGAAQVMTYVDSKGKRVTVDRAYFTPSVLARPNLKIATQSPATRVLFDGGSKAVGVEFLDKDGKRFRARARKEVVLSAGAIHTPHILLLSGVGPADHLASHGIPVVADLPGVGSYLKDHLSLDLFYKDKSKASLTYLSGKSLKDQLRIQMSLAQYLLFGTGPLTTNVGEATAFARTSDPKLFPPSEFPPESTPEDVTSGAGAPDLEIFASPLAWVDHGERPFPLTGDYFSMHAVALRPKSHGTITLKSADPLDAPVIDPNYLAEKHDIDILVRGVRLIQRISQMEPMKSLVDPSGEKVSILHHNIAKMSDAEIAEDVRRRVETLYHPCCSARMAPVEDGGVVDPFLRVHGIKNLRICDASIFPEIVSGHTAAPVLAVAEKGANIIKDALRVQ